MSINRTPAGVPTGGQFAASARGEAAATLDTVRPSGPAVVCDLYTVERRKARGAYAVALRKDDIVEIATEQGRLDVIGEVSLMLARPDLEPIYEMSSDWRRAALRLRRDGSNHPLPKPDGLSVEHARRCRDFCFTQAARFGEDSRVVPNPADEQWTDPHEWTARIEDHAYHSALADTYAYWACAFDAGRDPDPERVEALASTVRRFDFRVPYRFRNDPALDHTEQWTEATGAPPVLDENYPA